jgi:hypothetical protein
VTSGAKCNALDNPAAPPPTTATRRRSPLDDDENSRSRIILEGNNKLHFVDVDGKVIFFWAIDHDSEYDDDDICAVNRRRFMFEVNDAAVWTCERLVLSCTMFDQEMKASVLL